MVRAWEAASCSVGRVHPTNGLGVALPGLVEAVELVARRWWLRWCRDFRWPRLRLRPGLPLGLCRRRPPALRGQRDDQPLIAIEREILRHRNVARAADLDARTIAVQANGDRGPSEVFTVDDHVARRARLDEDLDAAWWSRRW